MARNSDLNRILAFIAARRARRLGRIQEMQLAAQMSREAQITPLQLQALQAQIASSQGAERRAAAREPLERELGELSLEEARSRRGRRGLESQIAELALTRAHRQAAREIAREPVEAEATELDLAAKRRQARRAEALEPMEAELAALGLLQKRGELGKQQALAPFETRLARAQAERAERTPTMERRQAYSDFFQLGLDSGMSEAEARKYATLNISPVAGQAQATATAAAAVKEQEAVARFQRVFGASSPYQAGREYYKDVDAFIMGRTKLYPTISMADIPRQYFDEFDQGYKDMKKEMERASKQKTFGTPPVEEAAPKPEELFKLRRSDYLGRPGPWR